MCIRDRYGVSWWCSMSTDPLRVQQPIPLKNYGAAATEMGSTPERTIGGVVACRKYNSTSPYLLAAATEGMAERRPELDVAAQAIVTMDGFASGKLHNGWTVFQHKELYSDLSLIFFLLISPGYSDVEVRAIEARFTDTIKPADAKWKDPTGVRKPVRSLVLIWEDQQRESSNAGFNSSQNLRGCLETEIAVIHAAMEKRRKEDEAMKAKTNLIKAQALDALEKVAQREPLIQRNLEASESLVTATRRFQETSHDLEKKYCWENCRCWVYIGVGVTLALGVLIVVILFVTGKI
eukprot:TRINITY_DN23547_c0_g1_i2.p1 TRINITY_DN23547_c0_g1~~TRINITY_DN23547_c0_g1_i2.p1  ORF type:complete len:293 (+),score=77.16 TRINITY_DN23547_c0_g1_i2:165-1043(+)